MNDCMVKIEEIKLPQFDLYPDRTLKSVESITRDGKNIFCLLYDDRMQFIETIYLSWNKTEYLLTEPQSKNKLLTHFEKLNRTLIVNCGTLSCQLMDMENGEVMFLDNKTLKIPKQGIQNVVEISSNDSKNSDSICFMFRTIIIHTKLKLENNKVEFKHLNTPKSDGNLHRLWYM